MQVAFRCGSIKTMDQGTTLRSFFDRPMKDILRHLIFLFAVGGKKCLIV